MRRGMRCRGSKRLERLRYMDIGGTEMDSTLGLGTSNGFSNLFEVST